MSNMRVAQTILEQLGGRKFIAMTGAKQFTGAANGLTFRLPGSGGFCKDGINYVRITLEPSDAYTVEFLRIRGTNVVTVSKHEDIYCDQLVYIFESSTGLRTSLGTMRA